MSVSGLLPSSQHAALLTVEQMSAVDAAAARAGVPTLELMENAGRAVAREVMAIHEDRKGLVVVLCGPGNNGGDGFVVARLLRQGGYRVRLACCVDVTVLRGDALVNAHRWQVLQEPVVPLTDECLDGAALVVDAMFGAGLSRPVDGDVLACIRKINDRSIKCIAVDVPSGVAGNSGEILGDAPRCLSTVTFFRPKPAHFLYPAKAYCGALRVADIGLTPQHEAGLLCQTFLNGTAVWALPRPSWSDHKYSRGHVLIFGSAAMSGAARLAMRGARRIGAGLVTAAVPASALAVYGSDAPGALQVPWDSEDDALKALQDAHRTVVVIGPGLPADDETRRLVLMALRQGQRTIVLDAGGLSAFADHPDVLFAAIQSSAGQVVLTPHEGEFKRLFSSLAGSRLDRSRQAAVLSGACVLLKGADTLVARPDGAVVITPQASPYLATAGSGDVLAGFIAGLAAQGMSAFSATAAGAWLHAEAGRQLGPGLIAEDLPECLPTVLRRLLVETTL